jgi:hypothetical protein
MALSNLQQRTISGLIGAALMISLIVLNEYTFIFLITALALASLHEFNHLISTKTEARRGKTINHRGKTINRRGKRINQRGKRINRRGKTINHRGKTINRRQMPINKRQKCINRCKKYLSFNFRGSRPA